MTIQKNIVATEQYVVDQLLKNQADWNQIDATKASFIHNKPFAEEMEFASWTCIPEIEVEHDEYGSLNPVNDDWFNYTFTNEGYYLVKINGENYAVLESKTDDKWLYNYGIGYRMGNEYLYNQNEKDNGEHIFLGCYYTESSGFGGIEVRVDDTLASLGTFTLEVIPLESYVVKQLNEKFIPDTISRTNHVHSHNDLMDKTHGIVLAPITLIEEEIYWDQLPEMPAEHYFNSSIVLENGKAYTVTLDEDVFNVVCENDCLICNCNSEIITIYSDKMESDKSGFVSNIKIETQGEQILQLDEKYIPDTIARKEDVVQSNWLQNDDTASDYIQNRPFYTTDPVNTELSNCSVEGSTFKTSNVSGILRAAFKVPCLQTFEYGKEYTIVINGNSYSGICYEHNDMYYCLGNLAFLGTSYEDTGEDYLFMHVGYGFDGSFSFQLYLRENSILDTNTVSIFTDIVEDIQLDEKYISYKPGLKVEGKTFEVKDADGVISEVIAEDGAEIFNNYDKNYATGKYSAAFGEKTQVTGDNSVAFGRNTFVSGGGSFGSGYEIHALGNFQHVHGKYNIADKDGKYAKIIGNGTSNSSRSNAHTLDWDGNAEYQGDVKANACGGESPVSLVDTANLVSSISASLTDYYLKSETYSKEEVNDLISDTPEQSVILSLANQNSLDQSYSPIVDSDLTTKSYVDAHIPTEDDLLALVVELGLIEPVMESDGVFYTAENDAIYIF